MKIKRRKDNDRSAVQAKSDANRERWVRDSSEILRMRDQLIPWVENHQTEVRIRLVPATAALRAALAVPMGEKLTREQELWLMASRLLPCMMDDPSLNWNPDMSLSRDGNSRSRSE